MLLALQPEARFGARMQPPNESWHYTMVTLNGCSAKPPNRGFPFVPEKKGNRSPNQPILPYLREVINKHARVLASPSRAASATSFAHLSETIALYREATTHSGGTRSLCHSERHSADTFEVRRGVLLQHDPVDRLVTDNAGATSAAALRPPLPRNPPRFWHRFDAARAE